MIQTDDNDYDDDNDDNGKRQHIQDNTHMNFVLRVASVALDSPSHTNDYNWLSEKHAIFF